MLFTVTSELYYDFYSFYSLVRLMEMPLTMGNFSFWSHLVGAHYTFLPSDRTTPEGIKNRRNWQIKQHNRQQLYQSSTFIADMINTF